MAGQDDSAQRILQQIANEQMANDMSQGTEYTANQEPFDIVSFIRALLGNAGGSGPQRTSDINLPLPVPGVTLPGGVQRRQPFSPGAGGDRPGIQVLAGTMSSPSDASPEAWEKHRDWMERNRPGRGLGETSRIEVLAGTTASPSDASPEDLEKHRAWMERNRSPRGGRSFESEMGTPRIPVRRRRR